MPCLRTKPKQTAAYLAYIDSTRRTKPTEQTDRRRSITEGTSASPTNEPADINMAGAIDDSTESAASTTATASTTTTAAAAAKKAASKRRARPSPRQTPLQLPTPDPSPTLPHQRTPSLSPEPPQQANANDNSNANGVLTPAERSEQRHHAQLEQQHRRMAIYGWSGPKKHGALHSGRIHEYVDRGRGAAINKREREEDRAALAAVGVVIEGL